MAEIIDDIRRIHIRLADIEQRKEDMKKFRVENCIMRNSMNIYEWKIFRNERIPFPILTFHHDLYAEFMIMVLRSLEINFIPRDQMMASELDECNQITFVMSGRYNYGFEINKNSYYRKQFGPSTIVGAYNVCFKKRH